MVRVKVVTVMRRTMQEESEQDAVDGKLTTEMFLYLTEKP